MLNDVTVRVRQPQVPKRRSSGFSRKILSANLSAAAASDGRVQENALSTSPTDLGSVTSIASDSLAIVGTRTPFATPGRIDSQTQLKAACDFLRSSMQKFVTVLPEIPLGFQAHNLRKGQLRTRSPQENFNGCP